MVVVVYFVKFIDIVDIIISKDKGIIFKDYFICYRVVYDGSSEIDIG